MKAIIAAAIATMIANTAVAADWQTGALKEVKSEKTVLDAKWRMPSENVLWVSMAADGSSRDGFAEYLCGILSDTGPSDALKTVWIYDPATYKNGGNPMGKAACR